MTDLQLILQPVKKVYVKMELLDSAYIKQAEIQGDLIDFSLTISAESDVRRVASATMFVSDNAILAKDYFGAWMDKMVQMYYGIYDSQLDEIKWFLLGSFLFTTSAYTIDANNRTLSVQFGDMMASLTEQRGSQIGYMSGYTAGDNIKNALTAAIGRFSEYKRTNICEFEDVIPYDIDVTRGAYPVQLVKTLVELWPWYEHFYSPEGIYTVQPVPTTMQESVVMTADEMEAIVISENGDVDYSSVKNCTEIWGKQIKANYTARNCVMSDSVYTLDIGFVEKYEYGALYSFTADANCSPGQKLKIAQIEGQPLPIVVENGMGEQRPVEIGDIVQDHAYVVKYKNETFILQGQSQVHVMCFEYNTMPSESVIAGLKAFHGCEDIVIVVEANSDFACDKIGVVKQVLQGGDYTNIYTTQLGIERAKYENWKTTRLQDSITIETLYVPWLDVNQKVEYRLIGTGEIHQYLIREIQVSPLTGKMQIKMIRFFPLYPWTGEEDEENGVFDTSTILDYMRLAGGTDEANGVFDTSTILDRMRI